MRKPECHQAKDGTVTWQVRFRHGANDNGHSRQTSETFDTLPAAEQFAVWLDRLGPVGALKQLALEERQRDVPTLNQLAAEHIALKANISEGTRLDDQRLWNRTWGPLVGDLPADQLDDDVLSRALMRLARQYKHKSLENQRGLLSGVCKRAVKKGYLLESPTTHLRLPRGLDPDDEDMTFLTPDEFDVLLREVPEHWRPLVLMLAGTGMRWGEAVALTGADIRDGSVRIVKAVKRDRTTSERVIGPPKTRRSRRTLALPSQVIAVLPERKPGETLFVGPRGALVEHQHFWENVWRPAVWRAGHCADHTPDGCRCGTRRPNRCPAHDSPSPPCECAETLGKRPRIHDLRHSHASWLIAAGVPLPVIQRRLGHESITTTVDRYGHLMPDAQAAAAAAADLVFTAVVNPPQLSSG